MGLSRWKPKKALSVSRTPGLMVPILQLGRKK